MDICNRELTFPSSNGEGHIFARVFEPSEIHNVRAVLQIAHGIAEHGLRYVELCRCFAQKGYAVCIHDHAGHGRSVMDSASYGYFGEGGYHRLVEDMHRMRGLIQSDYPNVPYAMLGHSMGSLLTRAYLAVHGEGVDAAVLCGTSAGYSRAVMRAGKAMAAAVVQKEGPKAVSKLLHTVIFAGYNRKFEPVQTENDWLCRDESVVRQYQEDPLCGFLFTASGYQELMNLLSDVNHASWYERMPNIPILLSAGDMDPVGNYGKGVRKVADKLRRTGHDVTLKLYPNARHEVLNEINKREVIGDIEEFLEEVLF